MDQPQPGVPHVPRAPTNVGEASTRKHLWAVAISEVPYALEDCAFGRALPLKVIKHTNLTGGADAHCAGESWFLADDVIVINGRSGRYGPRDEGQLRAAGLAIKACGYKVAMIGFDETNQPASVVVGEGDLEWL